MLSQIHKTSVHLQNTNPAWCSRESTSKTDTEEEKLFEKSHYYYYYLHTKVLSYLSPTCQLHCCLCRVRKLSEFIKNILRSYRFGTRWGWIIIDRNVFFWVNYPFKSLTIYCSTFSQFTLHWLVQQVNFGPWLEITLIMYRCNFSSCMLSVL